MAKTKKTEGPDIKEIRKETAQKALMLAETIAPETYIGELNDQYYYLAVPVPNIAFDIAAKLDSNEIPYTLEHCDMTGNDILYLKDKATPKENEDNENDQPE